MSNNKKQIKILQLVTSRQFRGAEVSASELSFELSKRGHQVFFAGLYKPNTNELNVPGCINIDLNGKKKTIDFFLIWRLFRLVTKQQPDIIQANGSDTLKYIVFVSLFSKKFKIVYRNISMVSFWVKKNHWKLQFNKWLLRKIDFVTSVGDSSLNDFISFYSFPSSKAKVIRRGIPYFEYDKNTEKIKLANEFNFNYSDKLLIHIGQFSQEKNHSFLIKAFECLHKKDPTCRLILIGEGTLQTEIKKIVKEKNLQSHIFFAGHQTDVQKYLAASDLFVLCSLVEGVPGVILEAAIQKVPSLASNVGGVNEVIRNGFSGVLIDDNNADEFANEIHQLLTNDPERIRLGLNAFEFVKGHFSIQKCATDFEDLYYSLID